MFSLQKLDKFEKYIFFVGFNKTGTTSLHKLFKHFGIPSLHCKNGILAKRMLENSIQNKKILAGFDKKYRVFSDMYFRNDKFYFEGNSLFRQLDHDYPGSLFIYNTRPMENWLRSRTRHKIDDEKNSFIGFYKRIYAFHDDKDVLNLWQNTRLSFEAEIGQYFRDASNYMSLDIEHEDVILKLNQFTGLSIPQEALQIYNKTGGHRRRRKGIETVLFSRLWRNSKTID